MEIHHRRQTRPWSVLTTLGLQDRARGHERPRQTNQATWRNHPRRLGHEHQRRRAAIAPLVNAGKATCCRCHEPSHAGEDWPLDHSADRNGYLGRAHARCNRAAAAAVTNGRRPQQPFAERPYKWSQRWRDDPPIGTINYDGGQNPEIYLGNGEWQPLGETPTH